MNGHYRHHLKRLSSRVREARVVANRIMRQFGVEAEIVDADGYYMWMALPEGVDDIELTRRAAQEGIFLAPGSIFYPEPGSASRRHLRLNIAYVADTRFHAFIGRELS